MLYVSYEYELEQQEDKEAAVLANVGQLRDSQSSSERYEYRPPTLPVQMRSVALCG